MWWFPDEFDSSNTGWNNSCLDQRRGGKEGSVGWLKMGISLEDQQFVVMVNEGGSTYSLCHVAGTSFA
jgi:hypothetical protein